MKWWLTVKGILHSILEDNYYIWHVWRNWETFCQPQLSQIELLFWFSFPVICVCFFFFFSGPLSICKMRAEVTDLCFFLYSVLGIMKYHENQTTWFCVQALPYTKSQTCGTHFFPLECEGFKIYISAESVISRIKWDYVF